MRWTLVVASGAALLLAVVVWSERRDVGAPTVPLRADDVAAPVTSPIRQEAYGSAEAPPRTTRRHPRLPPSLRDTDVDGALVVDSAGRFVATTDALALFDYFFSARGEESSRTIIRRIRREIRERLPSGAVADAVDFLDRYLAYRAGARALAEAAPRDEDLAGRLQALHALRVATFGAATAERLFAAEEERIRSVLERRAIQTDPTLDDDSRHDRLAALEATVPAGVQAARERALAPTRLLEDERRLRATGAAPATIAALREERFGPEAAARLAELDRRRAAWERRLADYRAERAAIETNGRLSAAARRAALEQLQVERFTALERRRVEALDRLSRGRPD